MKAKKSEYIAIILFCTFLAAVALGYLLLPKADFSPLEKRNLEQFPAVSWRSIRSGDWGEEFETYLADHMPGRNFFVGLNAYFEYFTGRQAAKDIRVVDGRLVEAPVQENEAAVTRCMEPINRFAQTVGQEVDLTIIPSAGWSTGAKGYSDAALIDSIYARAGEQVSAFDLTDVFAGRPELYYRTDHHWNSVGAYEAYAAYMASKGRPCRDRADFRVTAAENFHGSTYSRSGLWLTPGETIELWQGAKTCASPMRKRRSPTTAYSIGSGWKGRISIPSFWTATIPWCASRTRQGREDCWSSGIPIPIAWAASWRNPTPRWCWWICAITSSRFPSWLPRSLLTTS